MPAARGFEETGARVLMLLTRIDLPEPDTDLTEQRYLGALDLCRKSLSDDIPPFTEITLDEIKFTLQICKELLPDATGTPRWHDEDRRRDRARDWSIQRRR